MPCTRRARACSASDLSRVKRALSQAVPPIKGALSPHRAGVFSRMALGSVRSGSSGFDPMSGPMAQGLAQRVVPSSGGNSGSVSPARGFTNGACSALLVTVPPMEAGASPAGTEPAEDFASSTASALRALAGPGTGKTYAMVQRVARLLEDGVDPRRLLIVTFARTAARDLVSAVAELEAGAGQTVPRTLHSFCFSLLGRERVLQATHRHPRILLGFERDLLLEDLEGEFGGLGISVVSFWRLKQHGHVSGRMSLVSRCRAWTKRSRMPSCAPSDGTARCLLARSSHLL